MNWTKPQQINWPWPKLKNTVYQATSMKVIRRNEETNDIDEKSPFLEHSIPVTRSPKVSGAGVQLSNRVTNLHFFFQIALFEDFQLFYAV